MYIYRENILYTEREHSVTDKGFAQVDVEAASAGPILCTLGGVIDVGVGGGGGGGTETVCPLHVVTSDGQLLLYHVLLLGASTQNHKP